MFIKIIKKVKCYMKKTCSDENSPNPIPVFQINIKFKNEFILISTWPKFSAKFKIYNFEILSRKN